MFLKWLKAQGVNMKNKQNKQQVEVSERQRPVEEQDRVLDSLDELELHAKQLVKSGTVATLGTKLNLEWNHKKPGFEYYWFVDGNNQMSPSDAVYAGWTFERSEHGQERGQKIIKKKGESTSYLMMLPINLHQEREKAYNIEVNNKDRALLQVGEREYAGDSKETGKGNVLDQQRYVDPEISPLMS